MGVRAGLALECDFQFAHGHVRGAPCSSRSGFRQYARGRFPDRSGVSTPKRHRVDDGDVDAHAGLQRAQLLELLALLQRRGRQRDEALQRRAAIGVEADVVVERPVARGRGGAGEIERAQPPGPIGEPTAFTTFGLVRSSSVWISAASVAISTAGSASGAERGADVVRRMVGKSPCRLTTISARPSGSSVPQRLEDPVRAGGVVGARHDRLAAMGLHGRRDLGRVGGDRHPADLRPPRPAAARGRSSAGRRYPAAACRAGGSRPCGRESAPECGFRSSERGLGRLAKTGRK